MRDNLATLPWVEPGTIQPDGQARQVKFTLKKGATFDLEEVKRALTPRYAGGVVVLTELTPEAPAPAPHSTGRS